MYKNLTGILGISGALVATFLGGFLLVHAGTAAVTLTLDGVATTIVTAGTDTDFAIDVNLTDDTTDAISIFIVPEGADIGEPSNWLTGIADVICGTEGTSFSLSNEVDCAWDDPVTSSGSIEFRISIASEGTYTLVVSPFLINVDDYVDTEIELTVGSDAAPTAFTFSNALTRDLDANGFIDAVKVSFSDAVDLATYDVGDITVAGYTIASVEAWSGDTSALQVNLTEGSSADTGAEPSVTVSGISSDAALAMSGSTTAAASDEAPPTLVSGEISIDGATATLTLSEDINGTTINSTGTDFLLSGETITAADETTAGIITLTLSPASTATSTTATLLDASIEDLPGSVNSGEKEITILRATDTTPITIQSVELSTSATSTDSVVVGDTVTLTFALAEVAATTTAALLNGIDVSVAATGATYTATYTVDAGTSAGAATFSISVLDEAGNETVSTTTTDGSALTIVQPEVDSSVSFSISLTSANGGMNLVSLPVTVSDTAISSVLGGISSSITSVWTYIDEVWYVYYPNNPELSNLTVMKPEYAYFIEVTEDAVLSGSGTVTVKERVYTEGWQLVGYSQPDADTTGSVSIDTAFADIGLAGIAYSDLLELNDGLGATPTAVDPGEGFWMNIIDLTFVPTPS